MQTDYSTHRCRLLPGDSGGHAAAAPHQHRNHMRSRADLPYPLTLTAVVVLLLTAFAGPGRAEVARSRPTGPAAAAGSRGRKVARGRTAGPEVIASVVTSQKVVALTFDDGPDPKYTPTVLALARAKGIKVTFFLIGRMVQASPALAEEEVAEGHAIGNHTWDHHRLTPLTQRQSQSEITLCQDVLDRVCGVRPHLLRPPKGLWNPRAGGAAAGLGYPLILWSLELEHHPWKTPQQLAQRAIGLARPGAIILAHDGEPDRPTDHSKTLQALPILIDGLRAKGYRFVTVPELLALGRGNRVEAAVSPPAG